MPNAKDPDANKQKDGHDFVGFPAESLSHERANNSNSDPSQEVSLTLLEFALLLSCSLFLIAFVFINSFESLKFHSSMCLTSASYLLLKKHLPLFFSGWVQ